MGLVSLVRGDFDPGQPVPAWIPDRTQLAYAAAVVMTVAGVALQWRPAMPRAAAVLTVYYLVFVVLIMNGGVVAAHPSVYGTYEGVAEQLAIVAAGMICCGAAFSNLPKGHAETVTRVGQVSFAVCAIVFGGAHFVYMGLTAPLVPKWLPPSQQFWAYATGVFHIAAGVAIITRFKARLAAILLTVMCAAFTALVHLPLLIGAPHTVFFWTENALNLALIGSAWVVADSLDRLGRPSCKSLEAGA